MIFKQYDDGGGELEFNDEEIKTLTKTKKLIFDPTGLRDFGNNLMKVIFETFDKLPNEEKERQTKSPIVKTKND